MLSKPTRRSDFTVAIICALPLEYDAVEYTLDEVWANEYGRGAGDTNQYKTGRIGQHNVVLALLPGMGKANAASAAAQVRMSFTGVLLALIVGVCGALPFHHDEGEVLLGDVIVGTKVVQYDFGRQYSNVFLRKDMADSQRETSKDVKGLVNMMTTRGVKRQADAILKAIQNRSKEDGQRRLYDYPGWEKDLLYMPEYRHRHRQRPIECICKDCGTDSDSVCDPAMKAPCLETGCESQHLISRRRLRQSELDIEPAPRSEIHVGVIASADSVMRSALHRDRLAADDGSAVMVEMEGAGAWDELPCVVLKGVCDYADSHKNKGWQNFAAASAAAATKAMIQQYSKTDTPERPEGVAAGPVNNFAGMTINGTYSFPGMVNNGHQVFNVTTGAR